MNESRWAVAKKKWWGTPPPPGLKHGQTSWARKAYGCDCRTCLPSGSTRRGRSPIGDVPMTQGERTKRLRATKKGTPVPPGTKHGIYAYRVYGCMCDVCRKANHDARQRQVNAWRASARGHWHDDEERGITVVHWPPAVLEETWQCPDCDYKREVPA